MVGGKEEGGDKGMEEMEYGERGKGRMLMVLGL